MSVGILFLLIKYSCFQLKPIYFRKQLCSFIYFHKCNINRQIKGISFTLINLVNFGIIQKPSLVKVHKVFIKNIKGTATTPTVVKLRCSKANNGCENVRISDIHLTYHGPHGPARQECCNVRPIYSGKMVPPGCAPR